jgi:energy-coupling factor transporter ATP-binding protein EcfA2
MSAVAEINRFVIRPQKPIQLVLGTNGSGKSSFMKEANPLPPDPNLYHKDGSKIFRAVGRGNDYVLTSTFNPKTHHSFIKNGEEKNPGGTIGAQLKLIKEEFNLTPEIQKLMVGEEIFTAMGPTKRREWFTQLSDISYDYALSVFMKLKDQSRDITGALRNAKKRIVTEAAKVITADEENKLREEVASTLKELRALIAQSAPVERPVSEYRNDTEYMREELARLSQRLLRLKVAKPYGVTDPYSVDPRRPKERDDIGELVLPIFNSVADIDSLVDQLRHEATAKEALINRAVQEHSKLTETVEILVKTGQEGVKSLQEKIAQERQLRDKALAQRKLGIEGLNPRNASSALMSVMEVLNEVFSALPANEDMRFSRTNQQAAQEKHAKLKNERAQKTATLADLVARKSHMESHRANGALQCPSCSHTWHQGFDQRRLDQIIAGIADTEELIKKLDEEIALAEEEIAAFQNYSNLYRDYMNCVRNWPVLQPFWDYLQEEKLVITSPAVANSRMNILRSDLEFELIAAQHDDHILEIMKLIESAEKVGDADLNESKLKLEECSHQIDIMTVELTELRNRIGEYLRYRGQVLETESLANKIEELMKNLHSTTTEMVEMMRREMLSKCIDDLNHVLAIKQETLRAAEMQRVLITDLEKEIKRLTVHEEAAKVLVREISPTDGLIADGLHGFIRKFTSQMSGLIKKIWSYPLRVLDCGNAGPGGAELDYKFPMMVGKEGNIVTDVKDGSSGQREIVNLAFKVTAMMYLGLQETPLLLDEFGASFDETHRESAMHAIKSLMDQKPFTQLFMVSHYESTYGAFTNAEICVLCPNNITVPHESKYNQHVTIE